MYSPINLKAKQLVYLAALAGVLVFAACDINSITDPNAGGNYSATESFSFEVQAASSQRFRLEGINGSLEIVGVSGARTARIWGERIVRSRSASDARAYLDEVEVRVSASNAEVLAKTIQPEDTNGREVVVNYHVRIPAAWQAQLYNANGLARVDSLRNRVAFEIANGQVQVYDVVGEVDIALTNGNVLLENVLGNAQVVVTNGNVDAALVLPTPGTCAVGVINGNIALALPKNTSAQFAADVTNGAISVLDLIMQNTTTSRNSVRGQLGAGAGEIKLGTVNGTIRATGF
ncbi:MAG: DUF4097 family beta strand repeat-containing protein [candidate division KSB1 bacterium]